MFDRVEDHLPATCEGCGSSLPDAAAAGTASARQAFDLPKPSPPEETEYRADSGCRAKLDLVAAIIAAT